MKLSNDMLLQVYEYDNGKSLFEGVISISDDGYGISAFALIEGGKREG